MSNYHLPDTFWKNFASHYWEQVPGRFPGLFESEFISEEELFNTVVGMLPTKNPDDRIWISNKTVPMSRGDYRQLVLNDVGPRMDDQDYTGFFKRIGEQYGDASFGINIHRLERSWPELWFRFRDLVSDLNRVNGNLPSDRWDIDTFLGNYKTTPLGIHQDNAGVFVIGVRGRRTYCTWPDDYFKKGDPALSTLDTDVIGPHIEHAVRMELGPGDMVYWPSSNWHLVLSDGAPSVVVSISAYFGKKLAELLSAQLRQLMARQLGDGNFHKFFQLHDERSKLPDVISGGKGLLEQITQDGQFADVLQQYWLMMVTAEGLYPVPADPEVNIAPGDRVAVDPLYPVRWVPLSSGGYIVAVNGLAFPVEIAEKSPILEMLAELNSGHEFLAADLLERYAREDALPASVVNVLSLLKRCRAFRGVSDGAGKN